MRRRQFLLGLSATLLAARAGLSLSTPSDVSTEMLPLWPGIPPGGGGPTGPLQLSVLGFSAGGHLLGMAATRADERCYTPLDALDSLPARADGAALIYPIVTLEKPYSHTSTHRVLVGKNATQAQDAAWSVQHYVTPTTPPMFLVQAEDDSVSDPHNTLILQTACLRAGVSVEMHRYPSGGHGFGMGRAGTQTLAWPELYEKWLRER